MVSRQRQTLLFSATMPNDIAKLANEILKNPEKVEIAPQGRTVEKIDQRVYFVNSATKRALLSHLLTDAALERVIVFTRTKRGANRVAEALEDRGVSSEAIHGNKSQNARQKALDNFSRGKARVLVATDLASRGIDVTGVTHVINYELPADAESYVHRIGRTARAGASGIAAVVLRLERARPAQEHRAADQPAHRRDPDAGQRGHAGRPAAASARGARGARQRASEQPHAWWLWRSRRRSRPSRWRRRWPQSSPVRRSCRAARRRRRPSTSGSAATIATSRRATVRKVIVPKAVLPRATATARARRSIVPTRRARRATVRSAVRRAATAAVASVAVVGAAVAAVAAGRPNSASPPLRGVREGEVPASSRAEES